MNTTEINGYEIETFNQYDLAVGKKEGICPVCSHNRKPENRKAKCAMYDWERGLGTCMNCDTVFQLHTFKRKGGGTKEYVLPEWRNNTNLSDAAIKWFESRGISQKTLTDMKISEGQEWMPQVNNNVNTIQFNYFINEQLINTKFRDGRKNFKLVKGAEKVFYNINNIVNHDWCVIVEGEMDALSLYEVGITNVISVPNGATLNRLNLDYLDNCIEYFDDKQRSYSPQILMRLVKTFNKSLYVALARKYAGWQISVFIKMLMTFSLLMVATHLLMLYTTQQLYH